ncbi:MAG: alpha-L-fucosidase [Bacteroidetes bacterium]|nr:MAG: alpha-L-fucosidase [Bacteroidota bacterium]
MFRTLFFLLLVFPLSLPAQHDSRLYIPPADSLVRQKLQEWQDLKFGLLMHWGTYSQWGIVESWSLCPEDEGWCERRGPYAADWYTYRNAYEQLQTTFNPVAFDPDSWARAARAAGMRYLVFTTKHHDGFCMFDTKETDYKITAERCPFSTNPRADVTAAIFRAFRTAGFRVGAYYSKPDWHHPDFWWSYFPPKDRNVNYDLKKYPDRYQRFRDFTFRQLEELCTNYGPLDLLWLDGAWVRPASTIDRNQSWQRGIPEGQDLDMERIASMARTKQPGILIVDRWVPGPYENYLTPEQGVPESPLGVPWETCMTMGNSWSYVPNEQYKSTRRLIHTLCRVVSRGGNLLLNIAPGPDGRWHREAYERLQEIGAWMSVNGDAIYGTRTPENGNYSQGDSIVFTQNGRNLYAIYLAAETDTQLPETIQLDHVRPAPGSKVGLLGSKEMLDWTDTGNGGIRLRLPGRLAESPPCAYAWVFVLTLPED